MSILPKQEESIRNKVWVCFRWWNRRDVEFAPMTVKMSTEDWYNADWNFSDLSMNNFRIKRLSGRKCFTKLGLLLTSLEWCLRMIWSGMYRCCVWLQMYIIACESWTVRMGFSQAPSAADRMFRLYKIWACPSSSSCWRSAKRLAVRTMYVYTGVIKASRRPILVTDRCGLCYVWTIWDCCAWGDSSSEKTDNCYWWYEKRRENHGWC